MKNKLRRAIDELRSQGRLSMPLGNILKQAGIPIPQGPEIEVLIQILDELAAENVIFDHSAKGRWGKVTANSGDIFFSVGEKIGFL